jgi:hypothetical protein
LNGAGLAEAFLACLLAADLSAPACQSTVKLVATNLIASSRIHGIQLTRMSLCVLV